jgi:hypothetical protein
VVAWLRHAFSTEGSYPLIIWILLIYALAQALDIVLIVPFVVAKIVDQASPLLGIMPKPVIESPDAIVSDANTTSPPIADDDAGSLSPDDQ